MATALIVLQAVALGLMAVLVAGLLRSHAEVLARLHRLESSRAVPVADPARRPATGTTGAAGAAGAAGATRAAGAGSLAPEEVAGVTPFDGTVSVALHPARQPTLLAFLSSGCTTCTPFWDGLRAGLPAGLPGHPRVVVVTLGPAEESPERVRRVSPDGVPVVMSSEAWSAFSVPGAPYFAWIDGGSGRVRGEGTGRSWADLAALLADALADQAHAPAAPAGGPGGGPAAPAGAASGAAGDADEAWVDAELARAGILPGDPRLHPPHGTSTGG